MTQLGCTGGQYKKLEDKDVQPYTWNYKKAFEDKIRRLPDKWEKIPMGSGLSAKTK